MDPARWFHEDDRTVLAIHYVPALAVGKDSRTLGWVCICCSLRWLRFVRRAATCIRPSNKAVQKGRLYAFSECSWPMPPPSTLPRGWSHSYDQKHQRVGISQLQPSPTKPGCDGTACPAAGLRSNSNGTVGYQSNYTYRACSATMLTCLPKTRRLAL